MVGGALQLTPQIRDHFPAFHRWNGRVFMATAYIVSLAGIYMMIARHTFGSTLNRGSTLVNGLLILVCATIALRYAMAREIDTHRRWAMRLYLLVNGVWFIRI